MPYFAVHALDHPGRLALRTELRPAHRARLRDSGLPIEIRAAGPLLDEAGEMCGTLLVFRAASIEPVEAFVAGDPYVLNGLYREISIREFSWNIGRPDPED